MGALQTVASFALTWRPGSILESESPRYRGLSSCLVNCQLSELVPFLGLAEDLECTALQTHF